MPSIFKRKAKEPVKPQVTEEQTIESVSAELTSAQEKNAELVESLAILQASFDEMASELEEYKTLDKLTEQAYDMGFHGNVKDLLIETEGNYEKALVSMVSKVTNDPKVTKESVQSFLNDVNPSVKEDSNDKFSGEKCNPVDCHEAYKIAEKENPQLSPIDLTAYCMEKWPNLYGKKEGE